jgi:hypothetical protein
VRDQCVVWFLQCAVDATAILYCQSPRGVFWPSILLVGGWYVNVRAATTKNPLVLQRYRLR